MRPKITKILSNILHSRFVLIGALGGFLLAIVSTILFTSSAFATDAPFPYTYEKGTPTTNMAKIINETNQGGSLLEDYLNLFGINYSNENGKAIAYVQILINYVLALLGIISVVLIMYSFYSIFFSSKSDDAITNARKTVIGASVGLVLVGLSAYIVNFIFYIYNRGL